MVLLAIAAITNSGGVGAAAIVVPALIQLFGFISSDAIHLSRLTIFAGAFVNVAINWRKRDAQRKDRLLINYNLAAIMIPLHLAGAEAGVMLGRWLAPLIVLLMLFAILLLSIYKTY